MKAKTRNKKSEMRLNETKVYIYVGMVSAILLIMTRHPMLAIMMLLWAIVAGLLEEQEGVHMFDGAKIEGMFDPQHVYNVLARILSDREGVEITAKVKVKEKDTAADAEVKETA